MSDRTHPAVSIVEQTLRDRGAQGEVTWLDDAARTAALAAEALGIEVGAIANSLVFTLDGEPTLILTSGAHRVDTAWVGERLGGRLKRADEVWAAAGHAHTVFPTTFEELVRVTGGQVIAVEPPADPAASPEARPV
jgi:prolyl-tRNA editing enzyme YbaK/EbsC (Cys-tRNA(Pro) deacylase)